MLYLRDWAYRFAHVFVVVTCLSHFSLIVAFDFKVALYTEKNDVEYCDIRSVTFSVPIDRLRPWGVNRNQFLVSSGHNETKQRSRASGRWMAWRQAHNRLTLTVHTRLTRAPQCLSVLRRQTPDFQEQLVDRRDYQWNRREERAP